jgi:hypothetical protein
MGCGGADYTRTENVRRPHDKLGEEYILIMLTFVVTYSLTRSLEPSSRQATMNTAGLSSAFKTTVMMSTNDT